MRKIIHVDMDMFFAAVEIRDNPSLRGKPVAVGGKPNSRGVVATANYEARKYGIRSAMSCAEAYRRCPFCTFVPPNFAKYKEVSQQIREIFFEYTDLVEPLSLDEAFLDVTENKISEPIATKIAVQIKRDIHQKTQLTASAGVAPNKFMAKIASDYHKPDGLFVISPGKLLKFLHQLPVIKIPGIGKVTNQKLQQMNIIKVADIANQSIEFLLEHFGKFGTYLYEIAQGIDEREVIPHHERQSYGCENTFEYDILDSQEILLYLKEYSRKVFSELQKKHIKAKTVTLKIKYSDFETITRRFTQEKYFVSADEVFQKVQKLMKKTEVGKKKVRLAGVSLSNLHRRGEEAQLYFPFEEEI